MTTPKGRILCIEDDEDTRDLIILTLHQAGFDVVCADNAIKAIDLVKTQQFDLCLVDNWLPGISGEDLCKNIRKFNSKTPILFYSGAAYEADKARARASGAQGYLVKPATGEDLIAEVVRLIAESRIGTPLVVVPPGQSHL
jgi:two-component system OmpR family response regulator